MSFTRSFEHDDALLRAAIREFAEAGYEQASINTILKQAGMSKGQFYYHFNDKQALYFALIEVMIDRKRAFLAEAMTPETLKGDFFEILAAQLHLGLEFASQHPDISAFSDRFLSESGSPIYAATLKRFNFDEDAALDRLVDAAFDRGEFRPDLPRDFIRKTVGYLFNHVTDFTDLHSVDDAETNLQLLLNFMKYGLAAPARE